MTFPINQRLKIDQISSFCFYFYHYWLIKVILKTCNHGKMPWIKLSSSKHVAQLRLLGMYVRRPNYFSKFHRFTWKSACNFISTSKSQIQNFRKIGPKLKLQQFCPAWMKSHQIWPAGCVGLIEFVFGMEQLFVMYNFSQILD